MIKLIDYFQVGQDRYTLRPDVIGIIYADSKDSVPESADLLLDALDGTADDITLMPGTVIYTADGNFAMTNSDDDILWR